MMIGYKGGHFERDVTLWGARWCVAYPISYRQLKEMMEERGVEVVCSHLARHMHEADLIRSRLVE